MESSPRIARHLPTGQDLVQVAERLEKTINTAGWQEFQALVQMELGDVRRTLDRGVLEHVEYAHGHGQALGLRFLTEAVNAVLVKRDEWLSAQQKKADAESSA